MSNDDKRLISMMPRAKKISLLQAEFPNGKMKGNILVTGSITDDQGESFKIYIDDGRYVDYAHPEIRGNLIDLIARRRGITYQAARQLIQRDSVLPDAQISPKDQTGKVAFINPIPNDASHAGIFIGDRHHEKKNYILRKIYNYFDGERRLLLHICRYECVDVSPAKGKPDKIVRPRTFHPGVGWCWKGPGTKLNPLYGLDRLAERPTAPVIIVEGEKAADAAELLFPDRVSVSWMGGIGQLGKADFTVLTGRSATYWPDADEPGAQSIEKISRMLREAGLADFRVVPIPHSLPKGWDLADELPPALSYQQLLESAAIPEAFNSALLRDLSVDALIERLAYNSHTEQFVDLVSGYRASVSQLNNLFRHIDSKGMGRRLLEDPRLQKVQRFGYEPGNTERIVRITGDLQVLNLWQPTDVERTPGDASLFIKHMRYLCTSDAEFEQLANMLAFMAQYPGRKLMSAIVIVGPPGTGKSFIGHVMRRILGERNTSNVESTDIKSDYNGYMEAKSLVVVEEVMALGRLEIMNKLKPAITQLTVRINEKYVVAYEIENRANFIFLSNHEDALKLEDGDRRYFIIMSDSAPQPQDYYDRLWAWEASNVGTILDWLLSRDLTAFQPNARPPATEGRRRMIDAGRSDAEVLIVESIEDWKAPFQHDLVEIAEARQALRNMQSETRGTTITRPVFTRAMKAAGAVQLGQKKGIVNGHKHAVSLWAVREVDRYRTMSPQALVEQFVRSRNELGGKPSTDEDEVLL